MPYDSLVGPLGEIRSVVTVGGVALTTASTSVAFPPGTAYLAVEPRNFAASGTVAQVAFCPWISVLLTTNNLSTAVDWSENAQGSGTVVTLNSLASTSAVWVGSHLPFRGLFADVTNTNSNASVLSGTYWNGASMTNISLTDGTSSAATTFAQDGSITWTVPTDWTAAPLTTIGTAATTVRRASEPLFWVKLVVSAALDASVSLAALLSLARSTPAFQLPSGREREFLVKRGEGGVGGLEAAIDAGTGNLLVNVGAVRFA